MPKAPRKRNLFDPNSKQPYPLSRTRLENFLKCPRCFYLDRRLGVDVPSIPSFALNSAVDHLVKKEFDHYRELKRPHPLMVENQIDAIPFSHPDLDTWRDNFKGVKVEHKPSNFIFSGAVDDIWQDKQGRLIVVDYKSTSTAEEITLEGKWKEAYKRQMEMYRWLLAKNGFDVAETGYILYFNARKGVDRFDNRLLFEAQLLPHKGKNDWVDGALIEAKACLMKDSIPEADPECEYCNYRRLCSAAEEQ